MNIDIDQLDRVLELSSLAIIKVSGDDAMAFLNSQFTNDMVALRDHDWQFNGYCNAKGRLIAVMRLFSVDEDIYLIVPAGISATLIQRLQVYVFRAKVTFEPLEKFIYAYLGNASQQLKEPLPECGQFRANTHSLLINVSGQSPRYLLISDVKTDWTCHIEHPDIANQYWQLAEINDAIPTVYAQTLEKFIPQHVNLDKLGGVSFKKGCFPGQEVIARLHYLGQSKQTTRIMDLTSENCLNAGHTTNDPQTQRPLTVIDAVQVGDTIYRCLVVGQFD